VILSVQSPGLMQLQKLVEHRLDYLKKEVELDSLRIHLSVGKFTPPTTRDRTPFLGIQSNCHEEAFHSVRYIYITRHYVDDGIWLGV
jgi:hypothetical protein